MTQLHYILATFYIDSDSLIISNTFHSVPAFSTDLELGSDFMCLLIDLNTKYLNNNTLKRYVFVFYIGQKVYLLIRKELQFNMFQEFIIFILFWKWLLTYAGRERCIFDKWLFPYYINSWSYTAFI